MDDTSLSQFAPSVKRGGSLCRGLTIKLRRARISNLNELVALNLFEGGNTEKCTGEIRLNLSSACFS